MRNATGHRTTRRKRGTGIARGDRRIAPRRRPPLGQHFLSDRATIDRIVDASGARAGDLVVEIGPGRGALTAELVHRGIRVAAIEVDRRLADALRLRFADASVRVVQGDIREHDLASIAGSHGEIEADDLVVVANLPYAVSKPVAQRIVAERARIARAVLMFQREVAQRLTAVPGSRAYGPLSVVCGQAFAIEPLFDVPPRAFRPPPAVASCVTRWIRRDAASGLDPQIEPALRAALAACFARRRQTLRNNLRAAVRSDDAVDRLLEAADVDGTLRAEALDRPGFLRLAAAFRATRLL